jgi:hypothetical protein
MNTWLTDLKSHNPCADGYAWAKESNIASLPEAFAKLERGDWWLWLASAYGVYLDKPRLVTYTADCAEHVLPIFEDRHPGDKRPRRAVEAARAWVACPSPETMDAAAAANAAAAAAAASDAAYAVDAYAAAAYAVDAYAAAAYAAAANAAAAAAAAGDVAYAAYIDAAAAADAFAAAAYGGVGGDAAYAVDAYAAAAYAAAANAAAAAASDAAYAVDAYAAERRWQADRLRELFPEVLSA